ncbi:MAG: patatin-like phospholipase family protein [Planctomycetota bacterium]
MLALMMSGGGARAAYQIGVLRALARRYPDLDVPIVTGVSAGAINAATLACRVGSFRDRVESLVEMWMQLTTDQVFRVDPHWLGRNVIRWGMRLVSGGAPGVPRVRGLLDTAPLRALLERILHATNGWIGGVDENLHQRKLSALAVTASCYANNVNTTWVQGHIPEERRRPGITLLPARLHVDHVMASSALPVLFPAVQVEGAWYGDGGMSLTAPLSPARRLGASKILAVSTRSLYRETGAPIEHYPSPAEIAGMLINAIFLDVFDADALRMEQINRLIAPLPAEQRMGLTHIDLFVMRPSQHLGRLANQFEPRMPVGLRFLTRGLGTRETRTNDFLSMVMFQPDYHARLIELGAADAERRVAEIAAFLEGPRS